MAESSLITGSTLVEALNYSNTGNLAPQSQEKILANIEYPISRQGYPLEKQINEISGCKTEDGRKYY